MYETDTQESNELHKQVSIRKHNGFNLIVPTDAIYSDVENFEGAK